MANSTTTHEDSETLAPETKSTAEGPPIIIATATAEPAEDISIRPFSSMLRTTISPTFKRRIAATRWPDRETVTDDTQGVQLATMQKLAELLGDRI